MPLLVGRYLNKIDRKGRVSVPKPLRDVLQAQSAGGFTGVYVYPLFKAPALEACGCHRGNWSNPCRWQRLRCWLPVAKGWKDKRARPGQ